MITSYVLDETKQQLVKNKLGFIIILKNTQIISVKTLYMK